MGGANIRHGPVPAILTAVMLVATVAVTVAGSSVEPDLLCEASVGSGTSANLHTLGSVLTGTNSGEIDIHDDLAAVGAYGGGGFDLVDVSDPTAPTILSSYRESPSPGLDVKFSTDGQTAIVGRPSGVDAVDVSDPADPTRVDTAPLPLGSESHMVFVHRIAGVDHVFATAAGLAGPGIHVYTLTGPAASRDLTHLGTVPMPGVLGPHDMYVQDDPQLGAPVLYIADTYNGWAAFDISDPSAPVPLGAVPAAEGYTHSVQSAWIDGRRIVVTIQESNGIFPPGAGLLKVFDATVLSAPVPIGTWADDLTPLEWQHNIQIVDGRLYMAHYDEGFFVFDIDSLLDQTGVLEPIAQYQPPHPDGEHWDVVLDDGVVYTSDFQGFGDDDGGLYAVQFGCITVGDPAQSSTG